MTTNDWLLEEKKRSRFNRGKIYNKDTGQFFNRSRRGWVNLGTFYVLFLFGLGCLMAICFWVFFETLDPRIPRYQLDGSAIGTNPGLGFRPMPENAESTLIWIEGTNESQFMPWVTSLMGFLGDYYTPGKTEKGNVPLKTCHYGREYDKQTDKRVCSVDVRKWGNCTQERAFNYDRSSPCIFLKLNRIFAWEPDYYQIHELPKDMPQQLQEHIRYISRAFPEKMKTVWLSCEGETAADVEYLGHVEYYPDDVQGFPGYYFPYMHAEGYLSPLVVMRVMAPKTGVVINVLCKAWAKNIKHSRRDLSGMVHFELLLH